MLNFISLEIEIFNNMKSDDYFIAHVILQDIPYNNRIIFNGISFTE